MEIDSCPDCLGAWFDRNELTDFLKKSMKDDFRWEPKGDSVIAYLPATGSMCFMPG